MNALLNGLRTLRQALEGDLSQFRGLPQGLPVEQLASLYTGRLPPPRLGSLGGRERCFRYFPTTGQLPEVRVWNNDDETVLLIEYTPISTMPFSTSLRAELGTADDLEFELDEMIPDDVSEWNYATRGLVVWIHQPEDNADTLNITQLRLFAPCSLKSYQTQFETDQPTYRFFE